MKKIILTALSILALYRVNLMRTRTEIDPKNPLAVDADFHSTVQPKV
jgi:hypothetical protein